MTFPVADIERLQIGWSSYREPLYLVTRGRDVTLPVGARRGTGTRHRSRLQAEAILAWWDHERAGQVAASV